MSNLATSHKIRPKCVHYLPLTKLSNHITPRHHLFYFSETETLTSSSIEPLQRWNFTVPSTVFLPITTCWSIAKHRECPSIVSLATLENATYNMMHNTNSRRRQPTQIHQPSPLRANHSTTPRHKKRESPNLS